MTHSADAPYPVIEIQPDWVMEGEVMGSKPKFWFRSSDGESDWLFKYPQPNTGQHWSEKIAAEVADALGIPHARVELAVIRNERGSATESFARNGRGLYHGNQVLAGRLLDYDPEKRFRQSDHTLENIFAALDLLFASPDGRRRAKRRLAEYLVLDALIGNTDRHHENWGILRERTGGRWTGMVAPTFDHASSLGRELLDEGVGKSRRRLLDEQRIPRYAEKAPGAIYWRPSDKRGISPLELVQYPVRGGISTSLEPGGQIERKRATADREAHPRGMDERTFTNVRRRADVLQPGSDEEDRAMTTKTLFLAWQDKRLTREWFPIGRLDVQAEKPAYRYRYTKGAERAFESTGFDALLDFPGMDRAYESSDLFPLFRNRVMWPRRPDFPEYLRMLDLPETAEPFEILSVSGGYRMTDTFEVFPRIVRDPDGSFSCRFFLHGWRHVNSASLRRLDDLQPGEGLYLTIELTNPTARLAMQIQTKDYHMIGWAPRYLAEDLVRAIAVSSGDYSARVVRINPAPAPSGQRLLVEFVGRWPDYEPMSNGDYAPLVH